MGEVQGTARPVFSISGVARMLGVPVATLRTWEDRYRLVVPDRNASGHRLYTRDQVEQLRFVRARMAEGLTAADAHRLLAERLGGGTPWRAEPAPAWEPGAPAEPGARAESAAPAEPGARAESAALAEPAPVAILLAERDPYAAELQEQLLASEGFEVDVALSDEAARSSLSKRRPAVAVVELLISGGTGLDLCRSLKRHGVPVIVASVLQARDQALQAGADVFLPKPFDPLALVSAARRLAGLSPYRRSELQGAS
jgi:DNA-binding transcriptional MerR regulator